MLALVLPYSLLAARRPTQSVWSGSLFAVCGHMMSTMLLPFHLAPDTTVKSHAIAHCNWHATPFVCIVRYHRTHRFRREGFAAAMNAEAMDTFVRLNACS